MLSALFGIGLLALEYEQLSIDREAEVNEEESLMHRLHNDTAIHQLHDNKRLDITILTDETCRKLFCFTLAEIMRIVAAMQLPSILFFRKNSSAKFRLETTYAFAIVLRRLAYPSRLFDLQLLFGMHETTICVVFNEVVDLLYERYKDNIHYNKKHLNPVNLRLFSRAIKAAGSPFDYIIGFIDGTVLATCRPLRNQRPFYSGHKKTHGIKFQSIVTPDGITASLAGPFLGKKHDSTILSESRILDNLAGDLNLLETHGVAYNIYGDPAYAASNFVMKPFRENPDMDPTHKYANQAMSSVLICVEWEFGNVATLFAFLKFKAGQKLLLSRVAKFYVVSTLFKNINVCLRRNNETARHFNMDSPILEVYMNEINPST